MPRFSIVVPCYNAAFTISETIDSLRAQTEGDWEVLIIDDASYDDTRLAAVCASRGDPRFIFLENQGVGQAAARNMAIDYANGDIIAFCDADDIWHPEKLARLDELFRDSSIDAAYARVEFCNGPQICSVTSVPGGDLTVARLVQDNPVCTMSNVAVRAEVLAASGGFNEDMTHAEDLEWLIRLVGDGHRMVGLDEALVQFRTNPTGLSMDVTGVKEGRRVALATAARYGVFSDRRAEAIHLRHLARRALRVGAPPMQALRLACAGFCESPRGWFSDLRRGAETLCGAFVAPLLPRPLRTALFCH
ncbi:glycosyltransferase family 2 protein [Salipiger marinus]|uniref:Glycosyl transferase family 2 n=1 Tax=Salipiger marinus TaxID=555512 RepID=A0A1G8RJ71_9RHOB|nr:glycosyltransferase family A protein [Salipiger marinus]SDJ16991.1 Glycosyl transferase family 2 [Salipiger marinus]